MIDKYRDRYHIPLLFIFSTASIVFVVLHFLRDVSAVENAMFQVLISGFGLIGSYILGQYSARQGAIDIVKPHARASFRRVTALYKSLYHLSERIDELNQQDFDYRLELIQALVNEQIRTGQDAIDDWRDIVPEEVAEIERRSVKDA
jgi:hypothetical protein